MVDFKYKVTDIAKDFGISTKKVIETFAELTGETRKTGATFEENEVNALMEALTRETAVKDLGEYLASGKEPQPPGAVRPRLLLSEVDRLSLLIKRRQLFIR